MVRVISGDVNDPSTLGILKTVKPDIVIHTISLDHRKSETNSELLNKINVQSTWSLLDLFTSMDVEKFLYFSTMQVLGKINSTIITEETSPKPSNNYGLTHLICETLIDYYNLKSDTKCVSVRLSNSYGPPVFKDANCWWLAVNDICRMAFQQKEIILLSDGSPQRDFIYIDDVAKTIEMMVAAESKDINFSIYNLASGETRTILEISIFIRDVYLKRYGIDLPIMINGSRYSVENQIPVKPKFQIDISRIQNLKKIRKIDLFSGINNVFSYLENY